MQRPAFLTNARRTEGPFGRGAKRIKAGMRPSVPYALAVLAWALSIAPSAAWALVTGEMADRVADVLAIVVIIVVPIAGIYLFWQLHILPEKIAEKRNHPQKDAIRALCILSLIFGGMLWPIAWIWAYTKPTMHKLAYGTDEDETREEPTSPGGGHPAVQASSPQGRIAALRNEIDRLSLEGASPEDVELLKRDLAHIEEKIVPRSGMH
jgi:hypothetical protein